MIQSSFSRSFNTLGRINRSTKRIITEHSHGTQLVNLTDNPYLSCPAKDTVVSKEPVAYKRSTKRHTKR